MAQFCTAFLRDMTQEDAPLASQLHARAKGEDFVSFPI